MKETNGLIDAQEYHEKITAAIEATVPWTEPGLRISRLRLLSDPGFPMWDVSYCHGVLDGKPVEVNLPFHQLPKRGMRAALVAYAKRDGIYAHGIGVLNAISTLC
jgi:hypothetical protein